MRGALKTTDTSDYVISLDLGGTKMLGILIDHTAQIAARHQISSPKGNEAVKGSIFQLISDLQSSAATLNIHPSGIAIGAPGFVDSQAGEMLESDNMQVKRLKLTHPIADYFGLPTRIFHDVRSATLGEARFGSAVGRDNFALLNIGTGVAVGLYLDGKIYYGAKGQSGEIGHISVESVGPGNPCGTEKRLETLTSGPALVNRAMKALPDNPGSLVAGLSAKNHGQVTTHIIQEAAAQGDPFAILLIEETADYLGLAIGAMLDILSLECVVLGGGVTQMGELLLKPIELSVAKYAITPVPILLSKLGRDLGAIGAAASFFETGG